MSKTAEIRTPEEVSSDIEDPRDERPFCGVVRPISASGSSYSANHWEDVGNIIDDAVQSAGFEPRLVSEANSTGIIHARIVANLYRDPIVVCDISGKKS